MLYCLREYTVVSVAHTADRCCVNTVCCVIQSGIEVTP